MFVEKKYACDVRFKINVITFLTNDEKKKNVSSFYLLESCEMWHEMLDHANYNYIQRLINHELLPSMIF
jgi:hypothetical protein